MNSNSVSGEEQVQCLADWARGVAGNGQLIFLDTTPVIVCNQSSACIFLWGVPDKTVYELIMGDSRICSRVFPGVVVHGALARRKNFHYYHTNFLC